MGQQGDKHPNALAGQLERARIRAEDSYNKYIEDDAELLKFILDRLERVEKAQSVAYDTIRSIDWAL